MAILLVALLMPPEGRPEEEVQIPPEAHLKAVAALTALGPERGARAITSRVVDIIGIEKKVESRSQAVQATLKELGAKETATEVLIDLPGDVLFDFDAWEVRPDAEEALRKIAAVIAAYKSAKVKIIGHTDDKGAEEYNQQLSERRAHSVRQWLNTNANIPSEAMEAAGYGESAPVAPNINPDGSDNPEGRQRNRRVEIIIKKQ